jgi:hypothetical protein
MAKCSLSQVAVVLRMQECNMMSEKWAMRAADHDALSEIKCALPSRALSGQPSSTETIDVHALAGTVARHR